MQNNNPNDFTQENDIDLKRVVELLINSKMLIITITLIITTLSVIYNYQRTPEYQANAMVEIGQYYDALDNETILIESASDLIQNLKILFIYKSKNNASLTIAPIEGKLIGINVNKPSKELGEKTLNEITRYIENRHSLLLDKVNQKPISELTYEIKSLEDKIKITNSTLASINDGEMLRISNQIYILSTKIPSIDKKIESLKAIIAADKNNLLLLKSSPDLLLQRTIQSPTLDQVIFDYETKVIDLIYEKINSTQKKDSLESQLKNLESSNLESRTVQSSTLINSLDEFTFSYMSQATNLKNKVFNLSQEKDSLELKLEFLMRQNPISTKLIGEITSQKINHGSVFILMGFIIGLFLSIFIVLINNSFKNFKKEVL